MLYIVQCLLGAFIHYVKKKDRVRRPPQNYFHAIFGLLIIALALFQVHSGYDDEWPSTTGRDQLSPGVNVFFWVWAVVRHSLSSVMSFSTADPGFDSSYLYFMVRDLLSFPSSIDKNVMLSNDVMRTTNMY